MAQCSGCKLTLIQFLDSSASEEWLREFLYSHGVLPKSKKCPVCGHDMTLNEGRSVFTCFKRSVIKKRKEVKYCKKSVSQNFGTWFSQSKMPRKDLCRLVAFWITLKPPRQEFLCEQFNLSSKTCVDWCSFLREVCVDAALRESSVIGGVGRTVEINEAKIGKSKNGRGLRIDGSWIFGGIDRETKKCFFAPVASRGRESLLEIIKKYVLPGTTIISDCWKTYDCHQFEDYQQLQANQTYVFVDPDASAHTLNIKRVWREVKANVPRYGKKADHLPSHLAEFQFKRKFPERGTKIHAIFTAIGRLYDGCREVQEEPPVNEVECSRQEKEEPADEVMSGSDEESDF